MDEQELEEFEFRARMEEEAAANRSLVGKGVDKAAEFFGTEPDSTAFWSGVGAVAGKPLGSVVKGGYEALTTPKAVPGAAGSVDPRSPGQKYSAKTGYGAGPGETVREVVEEHKARRAPVGSGKVSKGITKNAPPTIEKYLEQQAREAREAAMRARNAPMAERLAAKLPKSVQSAGRIAYGAASGVPPWLGRTVAGASLGAQAADTRNRFLSGDVRGGIISGLGALGSGMAFVPHPLVRGLGTALGTAAPLLNMYLDEPEQKAAGGVVGYAKGKQVVQGGLSLAKKFGYDPKKVAQQYPETIPPVLTVDKKTGKEFLQKQLSPEALAVQKARKAAQAEIDRGEYTPFFDVSKRSYVNPADYPLQGRTLTDVVPKKAATVEKYAAMASDPAATERLMFAYQRGSQSPMAKDWYAMKQLEDEFVKEFGETEGKRMFRQRFAEPMAATTGGADPNSNLMMTAYTNFMKQQGKDIPINAYELPFPIGGRYVSGNMDQFRKYNMLGSIPIDNPKRHNFASNFMGYRDRPTIDEQMMGLFDPKKAAPEAGTYGVYEAQLNKLAESVGVPPVNFQDVAWAGAKGYSGKPMMQEINEMIYRTSRITGESPEEVLKGYLRGNKPMYGVGALGGLSAVQETGGVNNPE